MLTTKFIISSGRVGLTRMWTFMIAPAPHSVSPMIQRTVSHAAAGPAQASSSRSFMAISVISPGAVSA